MRRQDQKSLGGSVSAHLGRVHFGGKNGQNEPVSEMPKSSGGMHASVIGDGWRPRASSEWGSESNLGLIGSCGFMDKREWDAGMRIDWRDDRDCGTSDVCSSISLFGSVFGHLHASHIVPTC